MQHEHFQPCYGLISKLNTILYNHKAALQMVMLCIVFTVLHIHLPNYVTSSVFSVLQLMHAIGSIEAIAKASKEHILENTDLSAEKAETIVRFFRDPKYYLSAKISWSDKCMPFSLIRKKAHSWNEFYWLFPYSFSFLSPIFHALQASGTTILSKMITSVCWCLCFVPFFFLILFPTSLNTRCNLWLLLF